MYVIVNIETYVKVAGQSGYADVVLINLPLLKCLNLPI